MKIGKAGKAGPHAAYIAREGQYAQRLERGEKLEATEAGNMPAWAKDEPQQFWQAADAFERSNGTTYREMEIALPRELNTAQRAELVRAFVCQEIGERHAYQWAIHTPSAADGGEQPHVHLMFSERQRDGIERDPDHYFKRYNAKNPEKGGSRKGYGPSAGQTLTKSERADELKELRGRWEAMCNHHLEQAGHSQRIDMRSYAEQGLRIAPERKQLPSQWRGEGKARVIELREARKDARQAQRALSQTVPNLQAEIIYLDAERQKRAQAAVSAEVHSPVEHFHLTEAERQVQANADEIQRIRGLTVDEIDAEILKSRPLPVRDLVEQDPDVRQADQERDAIALQIHQAQHSAAQAQAEMAQWRERHKVQAWMHDKGHGGFGHSPYLLEREKRVTEARQTEEQLAPHMQKSSWSAKNTRERAESRIYRELLPARLQLARLEQVKQEKLEEEEIQQKRQEAEKQMARELQAVSEEFQSMAERREGKTRGWDDRGSQWQAAPEPLQQLIEAYNAISNQERAEILERLGHDRDISQKLRELLDRQQANDRENDNDQGLSL